MKIWFAKGSISAAAVIAAREAGVEAELIEVDFASGEQTQAAYLEVNPKGRVPALATDRGILTETGAILEYIAALAPEKALVPRDAWDLAQMRAALHWLASTMHVSHAHKMRGHRWASDPAALADMKAHVPKTMTDACRFVETELLRGPWVMGETYSVADIHLFVLTSWTPGDGVMLQDFPRLSAHFEAMQQRPAVKAIVDAGYMPQITS